jgi:hypothetical protein
MIGIGAISAPIKFEDATGNAKHAPIDALINSRRFVNIFSRFRLMEEVWKGKATDEQPLILGESASVHCRTVVLNCSALRRQLNPPPHCSKKVESHQIRQ